MYTFICQTRHKIWQQSKNPPEDNNRKKWRWSDLTLTTDRLRQNKNLLYDKYKHNVRLNNKEVQWSGSSGRWSCYLRNGLEHQVRVNLHHSNVEQWNQAALELHHGARQGTFDKMNGDTTPETSHWFPYSKRAECEIMDICGKMLQIFRKHMNCNLISSV